MRLLVANPNTTPQVTELCASAARAVASPGTEILPLTGGVNPSTVLKTIE